ncbi:MAG TPA: thermonuclease family protein [Rhizomicrobium sp.]|nr:thermonuclease family protein [Rhizomicrobium sp.]
MQLQPLAGKIDPGYQQMTAMLPTPVLAVIALFCMGIPAVFAAPPSCFPPVEIGRAKIVRVEHDGVLVLDDGRAARLEGLILPAGASDHAPDFYADQAIDRLGELATGHRLILAAESPKEDRYGRLRAQAFLNGDSGGRWLQRVLLEEGLARVSVAPDRNECAGELFAAERRARSARTGIWSDEAYHVRGPTGLINAIGTFQIVEGTIEDVTGASGHVFLEFGHDRRKDFAVVISGDDLKNFRAIGVEPFSYKGQAVRVRGWIDRMRRPEMEIATPANIEVMETPELRGSIATQR